MASVTVTPKTPAPRPLTSCDVAPVLHKYVYGVTPPAGVMSMLPLVCEQVGLRSEAVALSRDEFVNMNDFCAVQFVESVTVTVYNPLGTFARFCWVDPS